MGQSKPIIPIACGRETTAQGKQTVPQSFPDQQHIGGYALMLAGKQASGSAETGLDLVQYQQHPLARAQFTHPFEVIGWRQINPSLSLDGLDKEGGDTFTGLVELGFQGIGVAEFNLLKIWRWRPVIVGVVSLPAERERPEGFAAGP